MTASSPTPSQDESARALADFAAWLMLLAVVAGLLFLLADRYLPPQDLPWKPLRLNDPVGLATGGKIARAVSNPAACAAVLGGGGVTYRTAPDRESGFCAIRNAVAFTGRDPALSPAVPVMSCPEGLAYQIWVRHVVQPAARDLLASRVAAVQHYGTYSCRRVAGHGDSSVISQHAFANALDVSGFTLADGRSVTVLRDWKDEGPAGAFLRRVRAGGCEVFHAVLSPDYNAAHANHLHLDMGPWRACR